MKNYSNKRIMTVLRMLFAALAVVLTAAGMLVFLSASNIAEPCYAASTTYNDDDKKDLDDPNTVYTLKGSGSCKKDGDFFTVPSDKSSESNPIVIILDNVNRSQDGKSPDSSFITINSGNYVIVKLRGSNYIQAGEDKQVFSSDDGMAGIHVSKGSTVKVTSEEGDGSTSGSLEVHGGGGKYGGAGIGTRYNDDTGTVIIAGGTINAYGGHCAAGIGSGRDGKATDIKITGGNIYAEGGEYAAGIGGGDNVATGEGGDLVNVTITGGNITAKGGAHGAGIGCSEGGSLEGDITIENANINATGGDQAAGIGGGDGASFWGGHKILIKSGNIEATGGGDGAGIGGGNGTDNVRVQIDQTSGKDLSIKATGGTDGAGIGGGDEDADYVDIMLRGGSIKAYGGLQGAAIGSGDSISWIKIRGTGKVEAYGGKDATGIGGGNDSTVKSQLLIEGDTKGHGNRGETVDGGRGLDITAVASNGVEPGNGYDNVGAAIGGGKSMCCDITIKNAVLHTRADEQGADIGGGGFHIIPDSSGVVHNITIDNCDIQSSSKRKVAPGIGAGYGGSVDNIKITNTKYSGGGIGGAIMDRNYRGLNSVKSITIDNSDITAKWDENDPGHCVSDLSFTNGPLDHGAAGIGSGQYGSIDTITITNSRVIAHGFGSGAGIGGGGAGGQNFSMLALSKYDIGDVGTISISGCYVDASSGCAQFTEQPPSTISDGYAEYTINPIDFGGGAGIGSGSASGVEKIDIRDCDYVKAYSYAGAGIGGGCATGVFLSGWVDHIWMENIDKFSVHGGRYCAGIGTGGGDGLRTGNSCVLKDIYINNCGNVSYSDAKGGYGSAGVGLGYTSRYQEGSSKGDAVITIIDSSFKSNAGTLGAGIGGGLEEALTGYGGENPPIEIKGKCRIEAYGGDGKYYENDNGTFGGGAGIGGGCRGGCSTITIALTEDENTAKGTFDDPGKSSYYVKASGNSGAAGIGSGGNDWVHGNVVKNSADSEEIRIESGAVFAKGGYSARAASPQWGGDFYKGAGSGIGGGSAQSKIGSIVIAGGYITAEAGSFHNDSDKAADIGTGGDYSKNSPSVRPSGILHIYDGTVLAENIGEFEDGKIVNGGSVSGIIQNAKNTSGKNVYRTKARLTDNPQTRVTVSVDQQYNGKHIYTDPDRRLYLYLYQKGSLSDKSQTADITVNGDKRHYYGYTSTDHKGVIKMTSGTIGGKVDKTPIEGDDFYVKLNDDSFPAGTKWYDFKASGNASIVSEDEAVSTGAKVKMHADYSGEYSITGHCDAASSEDEEIYWGTDFEFKGTLKNKAKITLSGELTKVYDGKPVPFPTADVRTDGTPVSYYWRNAADDTPTPNYAPNSAGDYYVFATAPETDNYGPAESNKLYFTIIKAPTEVTQSVSMNEGQATIRANVTGLYFPTGSVKFTVKKKNERGIFEEVLNQDAAVKKEEDSSGIRYVASITTDRVVGGDFEVSVQYLGDANYDKSNIDTKMYYKDPVDTNQLDMGGKTEYTTTYSDSMRPIKLELQALPPINASGPAPEYVWQSEIISDTADKFGLKKTAEIDQNDPLNVIPQHAGEVKINVTLSDANNNYNPISKIVTVTVNKKKLYAKPYLYLGSNPPKYESDASPFVSYGRVTGYNSTALFSDTGSLYRAFSDYGGPGEHAGNLVVPPLDERTPAGTYPMNLIKEGEDVTVGDKTYKDLFYYRDFDIECQTNNIPVHKADIVLAADSVYVTYGDPEPDYTWSIDSYYNSKLHTTGIAPWDTIDDVLEPGAYVERDRSKAPGEYKDLPATYFRDALRLVCTPTSNYELVRPQWPYDDRDEPGTETGTLIIEQADISNSARFDVSVSEPPVYGEEEKEPVVSVIDNGRFGETVTLKEDQEFKAEISGSEIVVTGQGNYTGTVKLPYKPVPRELTVKTESAEKIYDGTPLTAGGTIEGVLEADKDKVILEMTGSQTKVGKSWNTFTINFTDESLRDKYTLKDYKEGTLTVVSNDIRDCSITVPSDTVYNGKEQKQEVKVYDGTRTMLTEGTDYELSYSNETPAGATDEITDAGTVTITVTGIGKYTGSNFVTYEIAPAPLKIDTESASKEYDGTPLTAGGEILGLVNGETASITTTGSITDAGSVPNTYKIKWDGTAKENNYKVTSEDIGTLTITPAANGQNGISASGYTGTYDGKEHEISGTAILAGSTIKYKTDDSDTWSSTAPVFKDATNGPKTVFIHAENADYEHGTADVAVTVRIDKAPLTVTTGSAAKVYDGSPLTSAGSLTGLVNDEKADLVTTGSQKEPGSSSNTYKIKWAGLLNFGMTAKEENYQITNESIGTLTVSKYETEVSLTSPEKYVILTDSGDSVKAEWTVSAANSSSPKLTYEQDNGDVICKYAVKTEDGSYRELDKAPSEEGYYRITLTAPATDHYTSAEQTSYFRVINRQNTDMSVSVESKVYDGEPVSDPVLTCSRPADDVTYTYYESDGNGGWNEISGKPSEVGDYKVVAVLPGDLHYKKGTAEAEFSISKRKILLDTEAVHPDGSGENVLLTLNVLNGLDELIDKEVSIKITPSGGGQPIVKKSKFKKAGNRIIAEFKFDQVLPDDYTVTPVFDDPDYTEYCNTRTYSKDKRDYIVKADGRTVELDQDPFTLSVTVTDSRDNREVPGLDLSYEIDESQFGQTGYDKGVLETASSGSKLKVKGAGKTLVKVIAPADEYHNQGVGYAEVTVNKGIVKISLAAESKTYNGKPQPAVPKLSYGGNYPVSYDADKIAVTYYETDGSAYVPAAGIPQGAGSYRASAYAPSDGNFRSADASVSYTISPASLSIETGSAQKEFDNTPLTCADSKVTGLADKESVILRATGSQTEIGRSRNSYEIFFAGDSPQSGAAGSGSDKATASRENYNIAEENLGTLRVTPIDIRSMTVSDISDVVYNGKEQKQTVTVKDTDGHKLTEDKDYEVAYSDKTDAGTTDVIRDAGVVTVTVTGKGIYSGRLTTTYKIKPAPLSVKTKSASKVYDGNPLTASGEMEGLVNGETAVFRTTGSQTEVGSIPNSYEILFAEDSSQNATASKNNYSVTSEDLGTLEVTANYMNSLTVSDIPDTVYDGSEQKLPVTVKDDQGNVLTEGKDYELSYVDKTKDGETAEIINAGLVAVTITGKGGYSGSLTASYMINAAPLSIETFSAEKEYNGEALTASGKVDGLVSGESLTLVTTGSITDPGSVPNGYKLMWDGTAEEMNYVIANEKIGTLKVTPSSADQNGIDAEGYSGTYDGKEHPVTATALLDGSEIYYSTDNGRNWDSEEPSFKDATDGPMDVMIKAENPNYAHTAQVTVTVNIRKARLTVTTESASRQYDGTPLTASGKITGLVNGEKAILNTTGSQTDVGSSTNTCEILFYEQSPEADASEHNYIVISEDLGTLRVIPNDMKDLTVSDISDTVYSGKEQKQKVTVTNANGQKLTKDQDYEVTYRERTKAGRTDVIKDVGDVTVIITGKGGYAGKLTASYKITPAPVKVKTESASKVYDGKALTASGGEITGLVNGETAVLNTTGSQKDVGSSSNTYEILWAEDDPQNATASSSNYSVTSEELGTLTVTSNDISSMTVSEVSDTVYNGKEQKQAVTVTDANGHELTKDQDYEVAYSEQTKSGKTDVIKDAGDVTVTVTGKGSYIGRLTASYKITAAPVKVKTESASKVYDGSPLTASGEITGLVNGETAVLNTTGTQTEVGSSSNTYEILWAEDDPQNATASSGNYSVTSEELGTLTVTSNDISSMSVSEFSDTVYNGKEQKQTVTVTDANGHELTEDQDYEVAYSEQTKAGETDEIIDAGDVTVTITGKGIYTGRLTASYKIETASVSIETFSADKEYDGEPLTASGEITGLVNGETATLVTTGTITDAGSVPNGYEIIWDGTAKETNYVISDEKIGTLIVNPASEGQNGIVAESYNGAYDGKEHAVTASALLDGSEITYSMDSGETWQAEAPVFKDAMDKAAAVMIKAVNPDYEQGNAQVTVTVMISKAMLTVTTESASKDYDGEPLTAQGTLTGLVNEETALFTVTGQQTEVGSSPNTYEIIWAEDAEGSQKATASKKNYEVTEYLGTLTVTEPAPVYAFTEGDGSKWVQDSNKDLPMKVERSPHNEAAFDHFSGIRVDGKQVSSDKYTAVSGSVMLTLKADYLDTLPVGAHTITADFDDGATEAHITVVKSKDPVDPDDDDDNDDDGKDDNGGKDNGSNDSGSSSGSGSRNHNTAKTGDEELPVLWIMLMLTSSILLAVLVKLRTSAAKGKKKS